MEYSVENTSLINKIIMVTGATSGIGKVTADVLMGMGATVILVGRNSQKLTGLVAELKQKHETNQRVDSMLADLSSLSQIKALADTFHERYDHLDVLVNNAGGMFMQRQESPDGIELTFALNHLNYFYLTNLLLDSLKNSPSARIVNVASKAHFGASLDFEDLQLKKGYSGFKAYGRSKLANILFTKELARRLNGTSVTVNALHPGFVATNFGKGNNGWFYKLIMPLFTLAAISPEEGAETSIYLASSPEVEGKSGLYFEQKKAVTPSPQAQNMETAAHLWNVSAEMVNL
ncbi:MAG: short-chain dehydrogenase [Anaerolineaceae bacterium]|nr:short-chain dehydrogenase [Anaerolineaceae bacterium]